jgi:hypothetical protein
MMLVDICYDSCFVKLSKISTMFSLYGVFGYCWSLMTQCPPGYSKPTSGKVMENTDSILFYQNSVI